MRLADSESVNLGTCGEDQDAPVVSIHGLKNIIMKLHLPLILWGCLTGGVVAQNLSVILHGDTTLKGTQYQETSLTDEYAVSYEGQRHALDLVQEGTVGGNGAFFQLKSSGTLPLSLSFANLSRLTFSGEGAVMPARWMGAVNLQNYGDARFAVENVSGDVSFCDFSGEQILGSPVHVWSTSGSGGTQALIRMADVSGKLSICRNHTADRSDMFVSLGLFARVASSGEGVSDAKIELSGIGNGIDISGNIRGGAAGYAGLIGTFNAGLGLASIAIDDIRGGIRVADNQTSDFGMFSCVAGSTQWNPPNHELVLGKAVITLNRVQGGILFENNTGYASGGLTLVGFQCRLDISDIDGDVLFLGNSSSVGAGAVYCAPDPKEKKPARSEVRLSADGGNIVFAGNRNTGENIANAMIIGENTDVRLNAAEGKSIAFYDPVILDDANNASTVHLNEGASTGEILFSGELYSHGDNAEDYTSHLNGTVVQYNGTVRLESKAAVETASYDQKGGVLAMGGGARLSTTGDMAFSQLTVRVDDGGNGPVTLDCGGRFSLTGDLKLAGDWNGTGRILEISAASVGESPGQSAFTRDGLIYAVDLTWNYDPADDVWRMALSSGDVKPEGVVLEYAGADVANAMLSTADHLQTLKTGSLNHLGTARFLPVRKGCLWADGLGGFSMQRSEAGREGYEYRGGGYAVGGEYRLAEQWNLGCAFGQIIGKNIGRDHSSVNRQDTVMGTLAADWTRPTRKNGTFTVTGAIGYGSTENELKSSFFDGRSSRGDWNDRGFLSVLNGKWAVEVSRGYILSPGVGLEYVDIQQQAFTETGDLPRRFDKGHYRNLSLPITVSLQKRTAWSNGNTWDNTIYVGYVPDVYRRQAETVASQKSYAWKASGARPARNAVRAGLFSRYSWNASWGVTGAYQIEARSGSVSQHCSLGLEYNF